MGTERGLYTVLLLLVFSAMGNISRKPHGSYKLLNLCDGLYILMQNVVILQTCGIVRKFFRGIMNKK